MPKAIAFFGIHFEAEHCALVEGLIQKAIALGYEAYVEADYLEQLMGCELPTSVRSYATAEDLDADVHLMVSIGGDGTMLRAVTYIGDKEIPLVGVNTGRLGFLSLITVEEAESLFDRFV